MATQTTGNVTNETKTYYDRTLLEAAKPTLVHNRWGQKRPIPKREGQTIQFRRFDLLSAKTTALVEGVTPAGSDLSVSTVTATPAQYGDWIGVSDVLDWTGIDPVIAETVEVQGVQAGESIDEVTRDIIIAGTTVRYANGRAARGDVAAGDNINGTELRKLRRTLRKNKAKPVQDGCFVAVISPDTHYDLQTMSEWQALVENSKPADLEMGIVKKMWQFAFVESDKAKIFTGEGAGSIDVHGTLALGKDFYGVTHVSGHAMESIRKPLGSGGTEDPLNQRGTVGWKANHAAVRLNESFGARLEHAVTG